MTEAICSFVQKCLSMTSGRFFTMRVPSAAPVLDARGRLVGVLFELRPC